MSKIVLCGLRDPMNHESCCSFQILGALMDIREEKGACSAELLRVIMHFLLGPDTDEEFTALVQRLLSCRCFTAGTRHDGEVVPIDPLRCLDMIISHLSGFILLQLEELTRAKFRKRKPQRAAARQPWPNSVADIGLGDRTTTQAVTALLRWAAHPPLGHAIFALLGMLSRFWEPYAREVLQNYTVVHVIRRQLVGSLAHYVHPAPPHWDYFARVIFSCNTLMRDLAAVDVDMASRYPHFVEELYDLGAPLIPLLVERGASMRPALEWFSQMLDTKRIRFPGALKAEIADPLLYNDDYFHARYQMLLIQRTHRCMNVDCQADADAASVVTRLCGRCRVVRYCGKQCQKDAWQAAKLPHQDLCKKIYHVRRQTGMLDDEEWTNWLLHSHSSVTKTTLLLKASAVVEMTCRAIWLHIMWLRREKKQISAVGLNVRAFRAQKIENINKRFDISGH
ncbi:hypothetical protein C8R44DRAFT_724421 [Mycena epipterygia]|nr:hypothetical protein C8R44DRAFT_724421 [Mycena epipterygia]